MSWNKYFVGGLIIFTAMVYLIISATKATAQYFLTVEELTSKGQSILGRNVRISGAIIGKSIEFNPKQLILTFDIADIPGDNAEIEAQGGLAKVLHNAVTEPGRKTLHVKYLGPKPDLLRNEAQAIITGHLTNDGTFLAEELLLKCPTKYEDSIPDQTNQ